MNNIFLIKILKEENIKNGTYYNHKNVSYAYELFLLVIKLIVINIIIIIILEVNNFKGN